MKVKTKREKLKHNLTIVVLVLQLCFLNCINVQAQGLGALIQTTTFETDFQGLVYLNLMENIILEEENSDKACENVKETFVRISMSNHYGSGNIFDITEDEIIVISNRHVLEYWNEESYITFMDGRVAEGELLYLSQDRDVGFLRIPTRQFGYEELLQMRSVKKNQGYYDALNSDESFFVLNITSDIYSPEMHQGTILDKNCYIPDFDTNMIYTKSFGKPGMSGSGMFDTRGAYIGMVTAGTKENELVGIRLPDILQEYRSAMED